MYFVCNAQKKQEIEREKQEEGVDQLNNYDKDDGY